MVATRMDLREKVPVNIVKWAGLETTMNELFRNFEAWEQRNAELVNRFFDQTYFKGEESLINKLTEIKNDIKFDDIEKEWINLAILQYNNWIWDFKNCLDKIANDNIKDGFINEIFNKVQAKIWTWAPYTDFATKCSIPGDHNVAWYFETVVNYLTSKEWAGGASQRTLEILKDITITNKDINDRLLATWGGIPTWINLSDPSIPENLKNAFDTLLSFEIGKEADRTINIAESFSKDFQRLLTNSLPAINTIVWESEEYKYDEEKLWSEYKSKLQTINADTNLSDKDKEKRIKELRREYYIKYLKTKNAKIWNALEQLYNNDFDYSKIDHNVLKDYFDKVADIRLKMLFDKWMLEFIKLNFWNIDEFKNFYKELTNIDPNNPTLNITLSDTNIPWATPPSPLTWPINIPIQRKLVEWKNEWLKDINQFWKNSDKSFDAFPMEFTINKADIDWLPITIEDRTKLLNLLSKYDTWDKYEIKWENIWALIYLFFIINSKLPITELDPEKQKDIESLFWQAKNHKDETKQGNTEESSEENNEWNEITPEKFKEEIEKLGPWKFENWSEIWLPMWESQLPGWWYQWMKIKISNINMREWTFKWTVFWWELKFTRQYEWASKEFKMNQNFFDNLNKLSKEPNKIWLQPNPEKMDFNSFRNSLNNRLWTSNLSFPVDWVSWNGNKFVQNIVDENGKEKEVEVKYFWAASDDKSTYKIKYNPIRRCFNVSTTYNWDIKWKDWKSEKRRCYTERDMDWNNFLIFFTQKWLHPQTEEESNDAVARQNKEFKMENGWKWKLNWFTINNIRNVFKTIKWNIKKKIDEYNKSQDEKLEDILVWDWGIYSKLAWITGFIPSMKEWLWELQQEYYNDRDSKTWKKIEYYLKVFQSDPDFWTTFEQIPPFAKILWWKSYKQFITDLADSKSRSKDDIHKAAALLLANIEKWASPYRWLAGEENSGLWVKALLGKAHYEQFMRDKQKCINDLKKEPKEKDQIQDVLATCEMDYIINNVSWANWKLWYFGSHEARWIPGEEGTDYIDNPSKRLLSDKFASTLKWSYKWRFNKSSVEDSFGKITHNDFNLAKEDFKRLIKSSRFPWAIANLKKMFLLAKTPEQQSEYQKCFLLYMLSGVLDVNGKKDLRKQTYQWAKTMWFLPGMLAKETSHSQKVAILLDDFCQEKWYWKFSESVISYFHEWDLKKWKLKIEDLIKELDSRWTVDKMKEFEKYSKSIFPSKTFSDNPVLKKLKESALDTGMENIDNSLLDNPVVANSWWLLSNANVVRDRMAIRDGAFDWKDPDERNNRAEFWDQIAKEVSNMDASSPESVNLVLNQYFSRFGLNSESDRQKAYKRIKTAYYWKDKIGQKFTYNYNVNKKQPLDMWVVSMEEIEDILRYTFQWTVRKDCFSSRKLPPEMEKALKEFQKFFEWAFEKWTLNRPTVIKNAFKADWINTEPMLLWSRNVYKDVFAGDWEFEYDNTEIWDESDAFIKDPKKKRKAQKRAFQSWRFINYEIAQIEKSFKNRLPSGSYRAVTQDTSSDIETRIQWLNAA